MGRARKGKSSKPSKKTQEKLAKGQKKESKLVQAKKSLNITPIYPGVLIKGTFKEGKKAGIWRKIDNGKAKYTVGREKPAVSIDKEGAISASSNVVDPVLVTEDKEAALAEFEKLQQEISKEKSKKVEEKPEEPVEETEEESEDKEEEIEEESGDEDSDEEVDV